MSISKNKIAIILGTFIVLLLIYGFNLGIKNENVAIKTSAELANFENLNNTKIGWGIKRNDNHKQPDLGKRNKELMEEYNGICMGNNEEAYIYLTFDLGYEAGYTEKILEILKANNVPATFFITAHYLNTEPELVKRMINEGHILGNQFPTLLMDL